MRRISGFCERCECFSPFLEKKNNLWLCTVCRDDVIQLNWMLHNLGPNSLSKRLNC